MSAFEEKCFPVCNFKFHIAVRDITPTIVDSYDKLKKNIIILEKSRSFSTLDFCGWLIGYSCGAKFLPCD